MKESGAEGGEDGCREKKVGRVSVGSEASCSSLPGATHELAGTRYVESPEIEYTTMLIHKVSTSECDCRPGEGSSCDARRLGAGEGSVGRRRRGGESGHAMLGDGGWSEVTATRCDGGSVV